MALDKAYDLFLLHQPVKTLMRIYLFETIAPYKPRHVIITLMHLGSSALLRYGFVLHNVLVFTLLRIFKASPPDNSQRTSPLKINIY